MKTVKEALSHEAVSLPGLLESIRQIGPVLSEHIAEERHARRLSRETMDRLREAGLFRLFMPLSMGGFETDPLTTAKVVEEVSRYNTAAGWTLMVANTSRWWCSRLSEEGLSEIFKDGPDTFLAGAFHPPMSATPVNGGYKIKGRSPLTSNIGEAKWIFVTAFVMEEGNIKVHNGIPEIIGVNMEAKNCEVVDTWYTIGMQSTDSGDVVANDVVVPAHLCYALTPEFQPNEFFRGKLYQYAAIGASIASLIAPVALAVARNAIEEVKITAEKKVPFGSMSSLREKGSVQRKIGMAEALVQSSRAYLFQTIESTWNKLLSGEKLDLKDKASLLLASTHTNQSCLQAVDLMYSAAGTTGIYTKNKLAGYFADAQVIRQHGFLNESRYETAAQVYLGLQPDLPVLAF
jgi:alkylation response protein AidB-like acyl-CoA dehydrogenase